MAESNALEQKEAGEVAVPDAACGGTYTTPRVDIYEAADEVVLQCNMPGVNAEQDRAILMDRRDTSFVGTADDVPDEEVISSIQSVSCHYLMGYMAPRCPQAI